MTQEECRVMICACRQQIDAAEHTMNTIAKEHIPDFHFLDYAVSNFWPCDTSPIGMCVFKIDENGRKTDCRYCGGPTVRK
jgi:hypothetical protein